MTRLTEWIHLVQTSWSVAYFSFKEERKVKKNYRQNPLFRSWERALKNLWRFSNPYSVSRRFYEAIGAEDVHVYGETPLTAMEKIGQEMGLTPEDLFVDLGCGRGRCVFFVSAFFGCRAIGVDQIPQFIDKARKASAAADMPVQFELGDMGKSLAIREATALYLAWTCVEEDEREILEKSLLSIPSGAKIATVSYPLSSKEFILYSICSVAFPWGMADVFIHRRDKKE